LSLAITDTVYICWLRTLLNSELEFGHSDARSIVSVSSTVAAVVSDTETQKFCLRNETTMTADGRQSFSNKSKCIAASSFVFQEDSTTLTLPYVMKTSMGA